MKKFIKLFLSLTLCLSMISSFSYASTNHRYMTESELNSYTKFDVNYSNRDNILATPIVDASEKIYDFANLFTDEEEVTIKNHIDEFINTTNMDFAVVTLCKANASDYDDMVFADDFYDYNDFGFNNSRDGILMLINIRNDVSGNRYVYFSTTGNGQIMFSNNRVSVMVDEAINGFTYYKEGYNLNYAYGVECALNEADYLYSSGVSSEARDAWIDEDGNYHYQEGHYRSTMSAIEKIKEGFFWSIIFSLIIAIIFYLINKGNLNNAKIATSANLYLKKDSLVFTQKNDRFLTTHTVSHVIESSSSSGSHTSSSGSSHGGGGGHF